MKRALEKFTTILGIPASLAQRLDLNFSRLNDPYDLPPVVREAIDCTAASVNRYLVEVDKDYYFIKTDAGANTITISASTGTGAFRYGGATNATIVLGNQGSYAWVTYSGGVWYLVAYDN